MKDNIESSGESKTNEYFSSLEIEPRVKEIIGDSKEAQDLYLDYALLSQS